MSFPPTIPTDARPVQAAWPELTCFGCGTANPDGMHLQSFVGEDGTDLVATIEPEDRFRVAPGVLYGGTVASLIDCHGVWTAMTLREPPGRRPPDALPARPTVTGELSVRYEAPTPLGEPLYLRGRLEAVDGRRSTFAVELGPADGVTATGRLVTFEVDAIGEAAGPTRGHRRAR